MALKRTSLKRTKGINPISRKRKQELVVEDPIRKALMERAGGLCEECHRKPDWRGLSPHEEPFRSQGGKVSMLQSVVLCGKCHSKKHGIREAKNG